MLVPGPCDRETKGGPAVTQNRRTHDPFAPHAAKTDPLISPTALPPVATGPDIENMTKAELIAHAYRVGVPTYGNKPDLITRIREATR